MIVPAGAVDEKRGQWRCKTEHYLFPVANLAKVFRAKMFDGIKALGLKVKETLPDDWVVHCKQVGCGEQALIYLGRYLYRGVISEKNILSDSDGIITFRIKDNEGQEVIQIIFADVFDAKVIDHQDKLDCFGFVFPSKCFHQGYFNSDSDMVYVTAQLFARPTIWCRL